MVYSFWIKHEEKIFSIAKGALIAAIGSGVAYALDQLATIDFGSYAVFVAGGVSVAVNILRKFGIPVIVNTLKAGM